MALRRVVRRLLVGIAILVGLLVVGVGVLMVGLRHPLPVGEPGPAAEELARSLVRAVDGDAWERTGAVQWRFGGHKHLWDRKRHLDRIESGRRVVLLDLDRKDGLVTDDGRPLAGDAARRALDDAWAWWANDSFWLNPVVKVFDGGTTRSLVDVAGERGLLIHYASGGVTPGDSYLWLVDGKSGDGRPHAWRMWVHVLPVPGLEASWEGWVRLSTGAWVATMHRLGPLPVRIDELAGAESLDALAPGDPFAALSRR